MATKKAAKKRTKKVVTKSTTNGNGNGKTTKKPSASVARTFLDHDLKIVKKATANPRREGTHGFESFALIKSGMTIAQFVAKGGRLRDLHWDLSHDYVELKKA